MRRILIATTAGTLVLMALRLSDAWPRSSPAEAVSCRAPEGFFADRAERLHEPAGFEPVTCLRFGAPGSGSSGLRISSWDADDSGGWELSPPRHVRLVPYGGEAGGQRWAARALFPAGWRGGRAPLWAERDIRSAGYTRLYVSFEIKLSEGWQGHPVNDKVGYVWAHGKPVVFPVYVGGGDALLTTQVRIQDVPAGARNLSPNRESVVVERGRWHRWEILLSADSGGFADGEVHWWIDGRKVGEHRDVRFGTPQEDRIWERVSWRPIWGGAGGRIERDQHMWLAELYVSGAP